MKRFLKIVLPSILMLVLVLLMRNGKGILIGLYLIFPLIYILSAILSASLTKEYLIGALLISVAFLVPINLFFHMGSCLAEVGIYLALGLVSYGVKKRVCRKRKIA